jgi:hypothetical protein
MGERERVQDDKIFKNFIFSSYVVGKNLKIYF